MKVLVTGANGLVGNSLRRVCQDSTHEFIFVGRFYNGLRIDLRNEYDVEGLFFRIQPDYIIHTAAKVGGIGGHASGHAQFFRDNILMNTHIIEQARQIKVKKLICFSSVCVFPDNLAELQEEKMHDGLPYDTNFAYAYAKRMIDIQIEAYKRQYGITNYCSVIPGNIYGPNDWYNTKHGHVIPSLIYKLFEAKRDSLPFVIWGDGKSLREFLYVDDISSIIIQMLDLEQIPQRLLVSGQKQYSIAEIVSLLVKVSGFQGEVVFDTNGPNGQRSRPTNLSRLNTMFPRMEYTTVENGLKEAWNWFIANYPNIRK